MWGGTISPYSFQPNMGGRFPHKKMWEGRVPRSLRPRLIVMYQLGEHRTERGTFTEKSPSMSFFFRCSRIPKIPINF